MIKHYIFLLISGLLLIVLFSCIFPSLVNTGNPICDNNLDITNYFGCFKITEKTIKDLEQDGIKKDVISLIESIKDKEFTKTSFKEALCKIGISKENMNLIVKHANYFKFAVGNKWTYNMTIFFSENILDNVPDALHNLISKQINPELSVEILEATESTYKERLSITIPPSYSQPIELSNTNCKPPDTSTLNEPLDWKIEKDEIINVPAGTFGCTKLTQTDTMTDTVYSIWISKYVGSFVKKITKSKKTGTNIIELKSYEFAK